MYTTINTILICSTIVGCLVFILKFIKIRMNEYNDTKLTLQKRSIYAKEKNLREVLSYRKYSENRIMEHREEIESEKAEMIMSIAQKGMEIFSNDYMKLLRMANIPLEEQLNALNDIIDKEFNQYVVLPRIGKKNKPAVTEFEATTKEIGNHIMDGLNVDFFNAFEAHGLSRRYVMCYITRELTMKLIMYSEEIRKKEED